MGLALGGGGCGDPRPEPATLRTPTPTATPTPPPEPTPEPPPEPTSETRVILETTRLTIAGAGSFGQCVALSGDFALVGAPDASDLGEWSGSAYVFHRHEGGTDAWGVVARLTASDGVAYDFFGESLSLSGDIAIVGSRRWGGSAYVFSRHEGGTDNWGEIARPSASDNPGGQFFADAISVSGDLAVVGARGDEWSCLGSAYLFNRHEGGTDSWGEVGRVTASDGALDDQFAGSVAVSGDIVVVGAMYDDTVADNAGAAYVFRGHRRDTGSDYWGEVKKLLASDGTIGDLLGWSVSVSGDIAVVGAVLAARSEGAAYVFYRHEGGADNWGEVAKLTASDGAPYECFGSSVSVSGDFAVVGADNDNGGRGAAYVFYRHAGGTDNWGEIAKLAALKATAGARLGVSVSLSEDVVLVGADPFGVSPGAAYIFERPLP